jgi:hypothetical protein
LALPAGRAERRARRDRRDQMAAARRGWRSRALKGCGDRESPGIADSRSRPGRGGRESSRKERAPARRGIPVAETLQTALPGKTWSVATLGVLPPGDWGWSRGRNRAKRQQPLGDLRSLEAIGRRWMSLRQVQFERDERVRDLYDGDPCAKPGFQWWRKKDVGKDGAVRSRASSPGVRWIRERRDVPQEWNALSN